MRLGSRFAVGGALPRGLSAEWEPQIRAAESSLTDEERASLRWTLTWLEGRPVFTLDNGLRLGDSSSIDGDD